MIGILVKGIVMLAIVAIVRGVLLFAKEKPATNEVHLPRFFFLVGLMGTIVFLGAAIWVYAFSQEVQPIWVGIVLILFVLMGISVIVAYINWQIVYDETELRYRTFLRNVYTFGYQDIENVRRTKNAIYIYTKQKRLVIDPYAIGIEEFFDEVNKHPFKQASTTRKKSKSK